MTAEAFVYDAVRTPRGKGSTTGALHSGEPSSLTTGLFEELRRRDPDRDPARVDDVVLGVVSPVGERGVMIARTAALAAGLPDTVAGLQIDRFCAGGPEAVDLAARKVRSGFEDLVLAGGVESMSRVPMDSDGGARPMDPETAAATPFVPHGIGADPIATLGGWSREDVDAYATESHARAAKAWFNGYVDRSVAPVVDRNGTVVLETDGVERIEHVHTAGNSSGIVDGAALVVVGREEAGRRSGLIPRAAVRA
jgi:acetyl-CoA C-acetyltransferase